MKVEAVVTYGGQYAMAKGQQDDLPDNAVTRQLIKEGYLAVLEESVDVADLTKAQLLDLCKQMGIEANDKMTKAQIVEAIEGAGHDKHGEAE